MKRRQSHSQNNSGEDSESESKGKKQYSVMSSNSMSRQLLQIFQSENFTPDQVIRYFISTFDEPGPHQFLTNKLLSMSDKFVEYYIPQFCYMIVKYGSYSMESFLEELCKRSISNFLKVIWCLSAYQGGLEIPRLERIERKLEAVMINCANKFSKIDILANQGSVDFNIKLQKMLLEKEQRFNYVSQVGRFVHNMIKLSLTLKQIHPDQRKAYLKNEIIKGNKTLRRYRQANQEIPFYWGLLFPFERRYENEDPSNLIVRIIETDFACFNTKTRVPYRILIETISENEILQKLKNCGNQEVNQSDGVLSDKSDDFLKVEENYNLLELQMRQLTSEKIWDQSFLRLKSFHNEQMNQTMKNLSNIGDNKRRSIFSKSADSKFRTKKSRSTDDLTTKSSRRMSQEIQTHKPTQNSASILLKEINQEYEKHETIDQQQVVEKIRSKFCGPWGEDWDDKFHRIREISPFKDFESLRVRAIIVKGGDDLRQELLAMQVIQKVHAIINQAQPIINIYLKPYEIIITSENSGILEYVPNTISMDGLKKMLQGQKTLKQFYREHFQEYYQRAQMNFVQSLAGYSLISFLLQIKDRHNGNILIDNQGHIIHIDFGFMLSNSPGNINFESAPFKLTNEYLELMNTENSQLFEYFRELMFKGFLEIRKHTQAIVQLVEIMAEKSNFPCFKNFQLDKFIQRFQENKTEIECQQYINLLISQSLNNSRTQWYDDFQKLTNGIAP